MTHSNSSPELLSRHTQEDLRRTIETVFDQSSIGLAILDTELRFRDINQALADINGLSIEEHVGRPLLEVIPHVSPTALQTLRHVLRTGEAVPRLAITGKDRFGNRRHYVCTYVPTREGAEVTGVAAFVIEVTEERERELWVTQLAANYGISQLSTDVATWRWDMDRNISYWSLEQFQMFEQDPETFVPNFASWLDLVLPEDRDRVAGEIEASLSHPEPELNVEYRFRRANGEIRWISTLGKVSSSQPSPTRVLSGMSIDVTERKEAQLQLEASEARYRLLTEMSPQLMWSCSPDGLCDYLSRQWIEFTGIPFEKQAGFGWLDYVHPDDRASAIQKWEAAYANGQAYDLEYRIRRFDGEYRWFKTRGRALRDRSGQITKWVGSSTDIHDQKAIEESLRRANENLNHFAYAVSHDLQEPLRTVAAYTQLLERKAGDSLPESARQLTGQIVEGAKRMQFLIRDLLAYAEAAHEGPLVSQMVDVQHLVEEVRGSLDRIISETGAVIEASALPSVPGSPVHLFQLFQNLISNALKYRGLATPRVEVTARWTAPFWEFAVRDNGLGIDAEHREKIFRVFQRLHGREIPGTGMGLAICQRIVENHGGRIWVDSVAGQGSTFRFTLRAEAN